MICCFCAAAVEIDTYKCSNESLDYKWRIGELFRKHKEAVAAVKVSSSSESREAMRKGKTPRVVVVVNLVTATVALSIDGWPFSRNCAQLSFSLSKRTD